MPAPLDGRVAIVTGAGRGLGRAHALELSRRGATVIVNDLGTASDGGGDADRSPAAQVVAEIQAAGGKASASFADVSKWEGSGELVRQAVDEYGRLDIVVNNAGVLRDSMIFSMTPEQWDVVIAVHLRGTAGMTQHAAAHWRSLSKAGEKVDASIVNTSSASGLYCNPSQSNYGAAKAGIASFTVITAKELQRYGIRVNAIAPAALTRLTENVFSSTGAAADDYGPERVSPLVAWLASPAAAHITGQVFDIGGATLSVAEGWRRGPTAQRAEGWAFEDFDTVVDDLLAKAAPAPRGDGTVEA